MLQNLFQFISVEGSSKISRLPQQKRGSSVLKYTAGQFFRINIQMERHLIRYSTLCRNQNVLAESKVYFIGQLK